MSAGCGKTSLVHKTFSGSAAAMRNTCAGAARVRAATTSGSMHRYARWCGESGWPHFGQSPEVSYPACLQRVCERSPPTAAVLTKNLPCAVRYRSDRLPTVQDRM